MERNLTVGKPLVLGASAMIPLTVETSPVERLPELCTIQNPAAHFLEGEAIFATGFVIPEEKRGEKGLFAGKS